MIFPTSSGTGSQIMPDKSRTQLCGTFGCTLPDKHDGLHRIPELPHRTRLAPKKQVRLGIDDSWATGSAREWSSQQSLQNVPPSSSSVRPVQKARRLADGKAKSLSRADMAMEKGSVEGVDAPDWWTLARRSAAQGTAVGGTRYCSSPGCLTSVKSLVNGAQRCHIESYRDLFDTAEEYLALMLVIAGRTIDLRMGFAHGDRPFSPRTFVLAAATLAHKLHCDTWYDNELCAMYFDTPCDVLSTYERGIAELLTAHASLHVSSEERESCIALLSQPGGILAPSAGPPLPRSPSDSRSSTSQVSRAEEQCGSEDNTQLNDQVGGNGENGAIAPLDEAEIEGLLFGLDGEL